MIDPTDTTREETDVFMARLGQLALAFAGALVMAMLGAGLGNWLSPGPF